MFSLRNDYGEGAHPRILQALSKTNYARVPGYGDDIHCENARRLIRKELGCDSAEVQFLSGGTQANLTFISAALRPYEGVIAARTAHIEGHEAGSIEATGHKILTVPCPNGKLSPLQIQELVDANTEEFNIEPKLVYISQSTEIGTVYSKGEIEDLSAVCRKNELYLYVDGARMAAALGAKSCDMTLSDIANYADALYIGGTKNAMLFGEALVILNDKLKPGIRRVMKQRGAILAKGWLFGVQFESLFEDGLYYELGKHADDMAVILSDAIREMGFSMFSESDTNQIFPIFPDSLVAKLDEICTYEFYEKTSKDKTCVRFVTSWATDEKELYNFIKSLRILVGEK